MAEHRPFVLPKDIPLEQCPEPSRLVTLPAAVVDKLNCPATPGVDVAKLGDQLAEPRHVAAVLGELEFAHVGAEEPAPHAEVDGREALWVAQREHG